MNTKVFKCFSRVYNSQLRTINLEKVGNLKRSNYILNILRSSSSEGTLTKDATVTEKLNQKVNISFIQRDGEKINVSADVGETVMTVAVKNDLDIEGACDGALACTTCHVYIDEKTESIIEGPSEKEEDLLDTAPFLKTNSRLGCQIRITTELEGVEFTLPKGTLNMHVDDS